jgi:hypothetical protein
LFNRRVMGVAGEVVIGKKGRLSLMVETKLLTVFRATRGATRSSKRTKTSGRSVAITRSDEHAGLGDSGGLMRIGGVIRSTVTVFGDGLSRG